MKKPIFLMLFGCADLSSKSPFECGYQCNRMCQEHEEDACLDRCSSAPLVNVETEECYTFLQEDMFYQSTEVYIGCYCTVEDILLEYEGYCDYVINDVYYGYDNLYAICYSN